MTINLCGQTVEQYVTIYPGQNIAKLSVTIRNPALWWPVSHGEQVLHDLTVTLGDEARHRRIGLRDIMLDTSDDDVGARFAFRVNGREVFMRGANWIPADALPERGTPELVRDRLTSAVEANFNMIRVWGGGQYEADWFYDICSELGILVWHDFMFACNLYPSHDKHWLASVRTEARQQIRRLSSQPCMALWCGDNELVGALGWYDESKADRDRYLAMYDRLNYVLEEVVDEVAPDIPFWPSSPSMGPLNFGDGWHNDTSGDMHFWDVWHSAKDFEHYRTVKPRFCSEFGFQSFPSMPLIETFTAPEDRSATSRVMDVHQRNDGGNEKIVETISRYFKVPESFEDMVYLSQVSQALAMKTSIEFWRSVKPRCMGTLYWQLNDTWPVASWSSLEYGGHWKVTQYMARRFHNPVLVTAQPDTVTGDIVLWAVNDTPDAVSLSISMTRVDVAGPMATVGTFACVCPPNKAVEVARIAATNIAAQEFLSFKWQDVDGKHSGQNDYLPNRPKEYDLRTPKITAVEAGDTVTLTCDVPALYVTLNHGSADIYSDNGFTLLPDIEKVITITRKRSTAGAAPSSMATSMVTSIKCLNAS
jgi:beta-mannosidase